MANNYRIPLDDSDEYNFGVPLDDSINYCGEKEPQKKEYRGFLGGDISEVTSEMDFKDESLYDSLYAQGISLKQRRTLIYDLKKLAQKIGKRDLVKYFQERCEEKKAEIRNAAELKLTKQANETSSLEFGKKTEYTGLPKTCTGNKYIGSEWTAKNNKVYTVEQHGDISKVVVACTQTIVINRILTPLDVQEVERKVEILFKEGNRWHTSIVNLEVLFNSNKAISLASQGLIITRKNASAFSELMASMYDNSIARDAIPPLYTVQQLGWADNNKYFMPFVDDDEVMFARADKAPNLLNEMDAVGSEKDWEEEIKKLRKTDYMPLKLFMAAMFASPILGLTNLDGFAVNVFGLSTTGKTITMQIAASIWGNCKSGSDLIVSPKSTPTALELRLGILKNIPLIIDDTAVLNVQEKERFQSTLMQMANGKSKDRGKKDLSLQENYDWKNIITITSEGRIDKDWSTGGSKGRVVSLENEEKPEYWDDLDTITDFFENNYGHAGRKFIKMLQKIGLDKVKKMYNGIHRILRKAAKQHGKMSRHAANVAFLVTADRIATKYIFRDGVKISLEEALSLMSDEKEVNQPARFYNTLVDTVFQNAGKFEGLTGVNDIKGEYWGIYLKDDSHDGKNVKTVSFIPKILNQLAKDADMDTTLFTSYLKKNNLLIADADGNRNQTKERSKKLGDRIRVVKIILPEDFEESKDCKTSENSENPENNKSPEGELSNSKEEFVEGYTDEELEELGFPTDWK